MDFFSGLSNIFHSIGHLIGIGNGSSQQKQQQQQAPAPQQQASAGAPRQQPAWDDVQQQIPQQAQNPEINLYQGPKKVQPAPQPQVQVQPTPAQPNVTVAQPAPANTLVKVTQAPLDPSVTNYQSKAPNLLDYTKKALGGITDSAIGMGQNLLATPLRVAASVAQPGADAINRMQGNATSPIQIDPTKLPLGKYLFGSEPVKTYQSSADDATEQLKNLGMGDTESNLIGSLTAPALAALDLSPAGLVKAPVKAVERVGAEELASASEKAATEVAPGVHAVNPEAQTAAQLATQSGANLEVPTYLRNKPALPAGPDLNKVAVPINPETPEGKVLLNADKPQPIPTQLETQPGTPDRTLGFMDPTNSRMIASDTIPGTPEKIVPAPGKNVTDLFAPKVSADANVLQKARDVAINKATRGENVTDAPVQEHAPLDTLLRKADNPTGTDAEHLDTLNQIILHPDATPEMKELAVTKRAEIASPKEVAKAPEAPADQPAVARTEVPEDTPDSAMTDLGPIESPSTRPATGPGAQVAAPVERTPQSETVPTGDTVKADQPGAPLIDTSNGSAKTGETGKSQGKFARGSEYDKTSVEASKQRGANDATNLSYDQLMQRIKDNGGMTTKDRDAAEALLNRYDRTSDEYKSLSKTIGTYHTEAAQTLGTIEKESRATDNPKTLTDRFARKLYNVDDSVKVSDSDFAGLEKKNEEFVAARDAHNQALEDFNNDPSQANTDKFVNTMKAAEDADRAARFEEHQLAQRLTKGNKDPKAQEFVGKLGKQAGVYTMDYVDTSMLSSTRVMLNNFLNTFGVRAEESMFGKAGAAIARKLTGTDIGGGSRAGAKLGAKLGQGRLATDVKLRQAADGNLLNKTAKNLVTSGNTLGERHIYASAYSGVYDHYRTKLSQAGYKGDELERRAMVNSLADPDKVADGYMTQALADNAMASTVGGANRTKIETELANRMGEKLGNSAVAKNVAKAVMRLTLGFPTVIGRSLVGGAKRATLGVPTAAHAVFNAARGGDPEVTAKLIKNSVKEFGSGATMVSLGAALGSMGIISGSYPSGKDERAAWDREKKTQDSIKIGGSWYSLPSALGVFALPFMMGANAGNNMVSGKGALDNIGQSTVQTVIDSMPVDSLTNSLDFIKNLANGSSKPVEKYLATLAASTVKVATPLGSFVGEVAKMFDPTANDTTSGDGMAQFIHKVMTEYPDLSNQAPDKMADDGTPVKNPNPLEIALGAQTKEQSAGVQKTNDIQKKLDGTAKQLSDDGAMSDKVRGVLNDADKVIFDKVKSGQKVQPADMQALMKGMTKNVDGSKDTRFLSNGDYDSNLAVLKTKRAILAADPTTPQSDLDTFDKAIRRGQVAKDNKVPYSIIKAYKSTSQTEWRNMGDPTNDSYNQKMYDALYQYDSQLAKADASDSTLSTSDNKYTAKKVGGGKGGSSKAARAAASLVKSNTVGSLPTLTKVNFGNLAPQKISTAMPTPQNLVSSTNLIKRRTITVTPTK